MARVLIIGGHGKVALLAAPKLVAAGHSLTAAFRNPDHEQDVAATGATPVIADVETMDIDQLTALVAGQDVVVWSAGAGGGNPARTYAVDRDAAIRTIDATVRAAVPRFVMVSYFGASLTHGVPEDSTFFPYAEAKAAADAHLRATDLAWTILLPSQLTLEPSTGTLDPAPTEAGPTSRDLVADVLSAVVSADPESVARTELGFTDGDVPIAQALAELRND